MCKASNWSLCLLCSILFIFSERKCISKPWRKLMNYKPENRIPLLLTDFDNIKDFPWLLKKFPDFSLTLKNFLFSLTFPWHILIWDFFSTFLPGHFLLFSPGFVRWCSVPSLLLVRSNKFNQKHFPDLGSDVSSCSTDFCARGETSGGVPAGVGYSW